MNFCRQVQNSITRYLFNEYFMQHFFIKRAYEENMKARRGTNSDWCYQKNLNEIILKCLFLLLLCCFMSSSPVKFFLLHFAIKKNYSSTLDYFNFASGFKEQFILGMFAVNLTRKKFLPYFLYFVGKSFYLKFKVKVLAFSWLIFELTYQYFIF
jgi:hypothetical protein